MKRISYRGKSNFHFGGEDQLTKFIELCTEDISLRKSNIRNCIADKIAYLKCHRVESHR